MAIGFWTDERIEALKSLYADGFSCRSIGAEIGTSRNSVIGKVHRLALPPPAIKKTTGRAKRAKPAGGNRIIYRIERADRNGSLRIRQTIEREEYKLRCVEIEPLNKALIDLEKNECRYAYGDGPFLFCAHQVKDGSSFCPPHHALCWDLPRVLTDKALVREAA